jgi:hypothetical protein
MSVNVESIPVPANLNAGLPPHPSSANAKRKVKRTNRKKDDDAANKKDDEGRGHLGSDLITVYS